MKPRTALAIAALIMALTAPAALAEAVTVNPCETAEAKHLLVRVVGMLSRMCR